MIWKNIESSSRKLCESTVFRSITNSNVNCFPKALTLIKLLSKPFFICLVKVNFRENALSHWCLKHLKYDKDVGIVTDLNSSFDISFTHQILQKGFQVRGNKTSWQKLRVLGWFCRLVTHSRYSLKRIEVTISRAEISYSLPPYILYWLDH